MAIQPELAEGAARSDLVLGTTLVDIKLYYEPEGSLDTMFDQLLTYVLADDSDTYRFTRVAVYLGSASVRRCPDRPRPRSMRPG